MFPSYRNQSVDLLCKSTDWFLYGNISYFSRSNPVPEEKELISTAELEMSFNRMLSAYKEREEVKMPIFLFESV